MLPEVATREEAPAAAADEVAAVQMRAARMRGRWASGAASVPTRASGAAFVTTRAHDVRCRTAESRMRNLGEAGGIFAFTHHLFTRTSRVTVVLNRGTNNSTDTSIYYTVI